jgi:acyl carrier protein
LDDECFETVRTVVAETLDVERPEIDAETCSANTPVWDSLAHLMIINAIEKRFSIALPKRDAYTVKNVGELTALVERQLGAVG